MKALSIKLPDPIYHDLMQAAERAGTTQSHMVREAIADYLVRSPEVSTASCAQRAAKWMGMAQGPSDLASNATHMADFGQ